MLSPLSPISPAASASRRNSGYSSVPPTPTFATSATSGFLTGLARGDSSGASSDYFPFNSLTCHRFSGLLLNHTKPLEVATPSHSGSAYYPWGLLAPQNEIVATEAEKHALTAQRSTAGIDENGGIRPRAKRSRSAVKRINVVGERLPELQINHRQVTGPLEDNQLNEDQSGRNSTISEAAIRLPAYLPLPHRHFDSRQLDEAFRLPASTKEAPNNADSQGFATTAPKVAIIAPERKHRPRPARLDLSTQATFRPLMKRRSLSLDASPSSMKADKACVYDVYEGSHELLRSPGDILPGNTDIGAASPREVGRSSVAPVPRLLRHVVAKTASQPRSPLSPQGRRGFRRPWSSHEASLCFEEDKAIPTQAVDGTRTNHLLKHKYRSSLLVASPAPCIGNRSPARMATDVKTEQAEDAGAATSRYADRPTFSDLSPPPSYPPAITVDGWSDVTTEGVVSFSGAEMTTTLPQKGRMACAETPSQHPLATSGRDQCKAEKLLGAHPLNRHLLAPAGLATGPDVYDGLVIDGPSFRLASDDEGDGESEDDQEARGAFLSAEGVKKWLRRKRSRVGGPP